MAWVGGGGRSDSPPRAEPVLLPPPPPSCPRVFNQQNRALPPCPRLQNVSRRRGTRRGVGGLWLRRGASGPVGTGRLCRGFIPSPAARGCSQMAERCQPWPGSALGAGQGEVGSRLPSPPAAMGLQGELAGGRGSALPRRCQGCPSPAVPAEQGLGAMPRCPSRCPRRGPCHQGVPVGTLCPANPRAAVP